MNDIPQTIISKGPQKKVATVPTKEKTALPQTIGKYKVISVIAKGGMGTVYKVLHPGLKREIILKRLTIRGNSTARDRFKQEARILLDLQHQSIVHMHDYFTEGSHHFIALEYVDGMSLDKLIQKQVVLPEQVAMVIFYSACLGLQYAHSKGIVHRDIKPGNILISKKAAVKLADFGIATSDKELDEAVDETGVTVGTPSYMPPEQFQDSGSVDKRADIYAMGVMLYEMLTGAKPFKGATMDDTKALIQKGRYIAPKKIDKTISSIPRFLIWKMMQTRPERRFQSMKPVIKLVKRYLKQYDNYEIRTILARMVLAGDKALVAPQIEAKKHTARNVALGICAGALVVGGFVALWQENVFHKSILSPFYKPLSVSVTLPATASSQADLPVRVFYFRNDREQIPEIPGSSRSLEQAEKSDQGVVYRAKDLYLRPGAYRIKVAAGPYVWWKSLVMEKEAATAHLDLTPYASRNITVHYSATDKETGKNITGRTSFSVLHNGKWIPLETFDKRIFKTGTVWKFMAQSPDYMDETFSLRVDWYQDELFLTVEMQKD
ncbi:MAG: protein kinase [Spirochaetaceae bacterium]|nr:protein kinase [Spirochaetaceae bacterium]